MNLIVTSKVKELAKMGKKRTGLDFVEKLNLIVAKIIVESAKNARDTNSKTIKARHLPSVELGDPEE